MRAAEAWFERERRRFFLWTPLLMGAGARLWLEAARDPPLWTAGAACLAAFVFFLAARRAGWAASLAAGALLALAAGWSAAALRGALVAAPILKASIEARVEGRLRDVQARAGRPALLILDRLMIEGLAPEGTPERARVALPEDLAPPLPGERLALRARLSPPVGASAPGAYDFAFKMWFARVGASGSALEPPEILPEQAGDVDALARLDRWRLSVAAALVERMGRDAGGVAAALAVGARGEASPEAEGWMRDSGLAHLLSISGLHMALMTGIVFFAVRAALAAIPGAAARWPIRKFAAAAALVAGALYLAASGADIPAERAFIMAGAALVAILLDRRAITLRSLAAAGLVALALRPESVEDPGFQMSFAATAALTAAFETGAERARRGAWSRGRRLAAWIGGAMATSLVAGIATAPYAAAAFNRATPYGFPANLIESPISGFIVMPALAAAAVLAPFGLEGWALDVMELGLRGTLFIAKTAAETPGAVRIVASPPPGVLALLTFGGAWALIWMGPRFKAMGLMIMAGALALWIWGPRPDLLIARGGGLVGLRGPDGLLALSHAKREDYAAETWLRRDGDAATQGEAAARPGLMCDRAGCEGEAPEGWRVVFRPARLRAGELERLCAPQTVLIAPRFTAEEPPEGGCLALDAFWLKEMGALAIRFGPEGPRLRGARAAGRAWGR